MEEFRKKAVNLLQFTGYRSHNKIINALDTINAAEEKIVTIKTNQEFAKVLNIK